MTLNNILEQQNVKSSLKDTLKQKYKIVFEGKKAKIVQINDDGIVVKFDIDKKTQFISNEQINNLKIKILNKNNRKASSIIFTKKSSKIIKEVKNRVNYAI